MKIDPQRYDKIAREVFSPVYPPIAEQIVSHTGVDQGHCLDVGCGGGYLGAALARRTALRICFFDALPEMLAITDRTIEENGLHARADTLRGDVSAIPLPDGAMDLAVSRGSIFFWEDVPSALGEIHRVLAPGGWAYVGGGFGSREMKTAIVREMKRRNRGGDQFRRRVCDNLGPETRTRFEAALETAGVAPYASIVDNEEIGLWIVMHKPKERS